MRGSDPVASIQGEALARPVPTEGSGKSDRAGLSTEQDPSDRALMPGDEELRELSEAIPHLVWAGLPDGSIYYVNQRWLQYTGLAAEESYGWGWAKVVHPDDLANTRERWAHAIASLGLLDVEQRMRRSSDGAYRRHLVRGQPMKDATGRLVRWFGTSTDIEDHKNADLADRRLAAIIESSDDAIISQSLAGAIISWNHGAERIFGYQAHEAIGRPISILAPTDAPDETPPILSRLQAGRRVEHYETIRIGKDGRLINVALCISPVRDGSGMIVGTSMIARDITDRKRAERALRASEQRFRGIYLSSRDAIVIADDQGRYTDVNPAACELFGLARERLLGRRIVDFAVPGFDVDSSWKEFKQKGSQEGTFPMVRANGDLRLVEYSATSDFLPGLHLSILRDVTERRRSEIAVRHYADRLAKLRELDQAILLALSPTDVCDIALEHLSKLLPCYRACVLLFDMENREVEVFSSIGAMNEVRPPGTKDTLDSLGDSLLATFQRGEPQIIDDLGIEPERSEVDAKLYGDGIRSCLRLPLIFQSQLMGSIHFYSDRFAAYSEDHIEPTREVAVLVAIAFQHARLFQEWRRKRSP